MNMVKKNLSDRQIFQKTTQKRIPSIFCQLGNVRFLKGKSNFDSFNLDFLQMQTRGRRRHSSEMNRFMLSKCYEKNSFFISCYFKSKNRSISLGHLIKHKPLFQMSEKISILNMYISTCWKLESSYASEFTEYALSLFWFPLAMYDFSYYCQILIQIQCSLSKLLQKYNQVPCKHSKKKSTSRI